MKLVFIYLLFVYFIKAEICYQGTIVDNIIRNCTSQELISGVDTQITIYRLEDGFWYPKMNSSYQIQLDFSISPLGNDFQCFRNGFNDLPCTRTYANMLNNSLTFAITSATVCNRYFNATGRTCILGGDCNCFLGDYPIETYSVMEEGRDLKIINSTTITVKQVLSDNSTDDISFDAFHPYKSNKRTTGSMGHTPILSEDIFVSLMGDTLVFKFTKLLHDDSTKVDHQVQVSKDNYKKMLNTKEPTLTFILPDSVFVRSGYISYDVSVEGNYVFTGETYISYKEYCAASLATFYSMTTLRNTQCLSNSDFIFLLLIYFGIFVVIAAFIRKFGTQSKAMFDKLLDIGDCILTWLKNLLLFIFALFCGKTKTGKKIKKWFKDKAVQMKERVKSEVEVDDIERPLKTEIDGDKSKGKEKITETKNKVRSTSSSIPSYFGVVMISLSIICTNALPEGDKLGCTTGFSIPVTMDTCVKYNNTIEECYSSLILNIDIPIVTGTNCFTVVDEKGTVFFGRVIYESFIEQVPLNFKYLTSDWEGKVESDKSCPSCAFFDVLAQTCDFCAGPCCASECTETTETNDATWGGRTSSIYSLGAPGVSSCRMSDNSALDCNVFFQTGCVWSSYTIWPTGPIGWVYKQKTHKFKPAITVEFWNGKNYYSEYITMDTMQKTVSGAKVSIIGNMLTAPTIFPYPDFIYFLDGSWKNIQSADEGIPEKLLVGDIQATNSPALLYPNRNSFIFDRDIASKVERSNRDSYTFIQSGFKKLPEYPSFPNFVDGNLWNFEDFTLQSYRLDGPAVTLSIDFGKNMSFRRDLNRVCPEFSVYNSSGCYKCSIGSSVTVKARSTCFNGVAKISSNKNYISIHTTYLLLTTDYQDFVINFSTEKEINDFNLILSSMSDTAEASIKFTAIEPTNPLVSNITYTNNFSNSSNSITTEESNSDWLSFLDFWDDVETWFSDIFDGVANWYDYLIFAMILSVGLVLSAFIITKITLYAVGNNKSYFKLV